MFGDGMKEVMFLGLGRVGFKSLLLFKELIRDSYIYAVDKDPFIGSRVKELEGVEFHVFNDEVVEELARRVDLAVTALPSSIAYSIIKRLINKCVDVVDVSFFLEDPYSLENIVEGCSSVFVPDAGFAPGYSNVVVGSIFNKLKDVEEIDIMVGGIPVEPIPPLGYVVTWNPSDLIEEYVRPARIIENGVLKYVDPFDYVIEVSLDNLGVLEGFVSDGLRTLIRNIRVKNMREITLRWPSHIKAMKLLRDLGLMSKDLIKVGEVEIRPSELLARLFEAKLSRRIDDIAITYIVATSSGGKKYSELSILYGSPESPATSTFTALIHAYTAKLAYEVGLPAGIQPLENLSMFKESYDAYLRSKGVIIKTDKL